jgi:hypothetical protein
MSRSVASVGPLLAAYVRKAVTARHTSVALSAGVGAIYFFSNPAPGSFYDYTFRVADAMLRGHVGIQEVPPTYLNEMVPFEGRFYSAFPLGAVLSVLPAAALKRVGLISEFPGAAVIAAVAAVTTFFFLEVAGRYELTLAKRVVMGLFPMLGTWLWANLAFGGAWHVALGFAVLGEIAALYFVLVRPVPWLAGFFFAVAFGNRTEIILATPLLLFLLVRGHVHSWRDALREWRRLAAFCAVPLVLGTATLVYNYVRFHSPLDFGYARIPGVLDEPWYRHGIFSLSAIPLNARQMLWQGWRRVGGYPYVVPTGFGGSILLSSPFLVLALRRGARDQAVKRAAWAAIVVLTLALWMHGNPGGWQLSYRYAVILLPWWFLALLEPAPPRLTAIEVALFVASVVINLWSTYLFLWTRYVTP